MLTPPFCSALNQRRTCIFGAPLQSSRKSEEESCSRPSGLRVGGETGQWDAAGPGMVDQLSCQLQWKTTSDSQLGLDDRIRCVPQGLGGIIAREVRRRTLDSQGMQTTHQLPGIVGGVSGTEIICRKHFPSFSCWTMSQRLPSSTGWVAPIQFAYQTLQ